jgi:hypothetical protein
MVTSLYGDAMEENICSTLTFKNKHLIKEGGRNANS